MPSDVLFRNIWILYPNCSDLIISTNQRDAQNEMGKFIRELAEYLVKNEFHVIILTSHCATMMQELFNNGLTFFEKSNFLAKGSMFSHFLNKRIEYEVTFYSGVLNGIRLVLFYGLNRETQNILSYNLLLPNLDEHLFIDKTILMSKIFKEYVNYIGPIEFPDIVHAVGVIFASSIVTLKTEFSYIGKKIGITFQPVAELSKISIRDMKAFLLTTCGINNTVHPVYNGTTIENISVDELLSQNSKASLLDIAMLESTFILVPDSIKSKKLLGENTEKIVYFSKKGKEDTYKDILNTYVSALEKSLSLK